MKNQKLEGEEIKLPRYAVFVTDPSHVGWLHCPNCKGEEDPVCAVEIENHNGYGRSFQCLSCGNLLGPRR